MKSYNETFLSSGNDITAITYYKNSLTGCLNVYVQNIDNIGSGTVYARIGETDDYAEMNIIQLKDYINYKGYSLTP